MSMTHQQGYPSAFARTSKSAAAVAAVIAAFAVLAVAAATTDVCVATVAHVVAAAAVAVAADVASAAAVAVAVVAAVSTRQPPWLSFDTPAGPSHSQPDASLHSTLSVSQTCTHNEYRMAYTGNHNKRDRQTDTKRKEQVAITSDLGASTGCNRRSKSTRDSGSIHSWPHPTGGCCCCSAGDSGNIDCA